MLAFREGHNRQVRDLPHRNRPHLEMRPIKTSNETLLSKPYLVENPGSTQRAKPVLRISFTRI